MYSIPLFQLPVLDHPFRLDLPDADFEKWCSDDKFLILGRHENIPSYERTLYVVVRDIMPNSVFLKRYGRHVENLRIYCKGVNQNEPSIYGEISDNCSNLKDIEFYDLEGNEMNSFNSTKMFDKIERVQFKSGQIGQNTAHPFKTLFKNVEQLEFSHELTAIHDQDIIKTEYQRLKRFEVSYDTNGQGFNESDIKNALEMNKYHLQWITLWGELSPMFLRFISEAFPQLWNLSMKSVPERVITAPPK